MKRQKTSWHSFTPAASSLYGEYIFRYASFVVLACLTVGFCMLILSAFQENKAIREQEFNRLKLAGAYLDDQEAILSEVADNVMVNVYYKPFFYKQNTLYELEIIKDLAKYRGYSPLIEHILLYYKESPDYLYSEANKCSLPVYLQKTLNITQVDTFRNQLNSISSFAMFTPAEAPNLICAAYELKLTGILDHSGDAYLLFIIPVERLSRHIERISGIASEHIAAIYLNDQLLYSQSGAAHTLSQYQADDRMLCASGNLFSVVIQADSIWNTDRFGSFCAAGVLVILVSAFILVLYAAAKAKKNYQPIGELMTRYHLPNENEIMQLDSLLESLHKTNVAAQYEMAGLLEVMDDQKKKLKEYLLLSMLGGTLQNISPAQLESIGLNTAHTLFCVFVLHLPLFEEPNDKIISVIESASDSQTQLSAVSIGDNKYYAIIASGNDSLTLLELSDMLQDILSPIASNATVCAGSVVHSMNECSLSLHTALYGLYQSSTNTAMLGSDMMNGVLEAADNGDYDRAALLFNNMCELVFKFYPITHMWQSVFSQAAEKINTLALCYHLPDNASAFHALLFSGKYNQFIQRCQETLKSIAAEVEKQRKSNSRPAIQQRIMDYVSQNAYDESLSLDCVADRFHLSKRQVERYITDGFGLSFRDYITQRKIEYAKELLLKGTSVADTSSAIGYSNVTYFIKRFKEKVGVTPGSYKSSLEGFRHVE